jgi:hypothetical protein
VLLPSGPDTVRKFLLRRTRSSAPPETDRTPHEKDLGQASTPLSRITGYRAPRAPRLARYLIF